MFVCYHSHYIDDYSYSLRAKAVEKLAKYVAMEAHAIISIKASLTLSAGKK